MSTGRIDALRDGARRSRDLGSVELWDRSLARSRQRRRLHELNRRARRRRKSISLALSAAMAGGPVFPQAVAAATGGSGSATAGADASSGGLARATSARVVLELGSHGPLVAALQHRLNQALPFSHLAVDGTFGPLTRGAVLEFQRNHGLLADGKVDVGMWAKMFNAPVLVFGASDVSGGGSALPARRRSHAEFAAFRHRRHVSGGVAPRAADPGRRSHPVSTGGPGAGGASQVAGGPAESAPAVPSGGSSGGGAPIAVVAPSAPTTQPSTYVLTNGVALPLPRQYITGGYVDQGVDYSAPGGTPEYAMGDGVIIGEGISGFGPNAPILKITSGPLSGLEVYYGHAGADLVRVGDHVKAGQQITQVGYGIVGISTGPHLEIGFYPTGGMGAGSRMLSVINTLLNEHPSGRAWTPTSASSAHVARDTMRHATATTAASSTFSVPQPSAPSSSGGAAIGAGSVAPSQSPTPASTPAPASPSSGSATPATTAAPVPAPAPTAAAPAPAPTPAAPAPAVSAEASQTPTTAAPADTTTTATTRPAATTSTPTTATTSTTTAPPSTTQTTDASAQSPAATTSAEASPAPSTGDASASSPPPAPTPSVASASTQAAAVVTPTASTVQAQ